MPRPRRTKKSHGLLTLVIAGLVLILVATVGGLYLFGSWGSSSGGVTVSIEGPTAVTSGDEVTYRISIGNRESNLAVADLTLEYPAGFIISSTQPAAANPTGQSLFHLAPLAVGDSPDAVVVTGRLLGAVGTAAELRARLDYQPDNFHSNFHVDATSVTQISASRLRLAIAGPSAVVSPGQVNLEVGIENVSDTTLNGLQVSLELPAGMALTSSSSAFVASASGEQRYDLGTLDVGATWHASLEADVAGDPGARPSLAVAVYQRLGQQRVIVERSLLELQVVQPSVELGLLVGQSSTTAAATWGSQVPVQLSFRSSSTVPLDSLTLRLRVAGSAADLDHLGDLAGGRRDGDAVVWDSSSANVGSLLQRLEPGGQGSVSFDLPIVGAGTGSATVQLVATLTSATFGPDYQATAGPVSISVQ